MAWGKRTKTPEERKGRGKLGRDKRCRACGCILVGTQCPDCLHLKRNPPPPPKPQARPGRCSICGQQSVRGGVCGNPRCP